MKTPICFVMAMALSALLAPSVRAQDCHLMDCFSGTTVHLSELPSSPFRVEVFPEGREIQPVYVYECSKPQACGQDLFFAGRVAERPLIRVTTSAGQRSTHVSHIEWRIMHPNGPRCPPECRVGTVDAEVPK